MPEVSGDAKRKRKPGPARRDPALNRRSVTVRFPPRMLECLERLATATGCTKTAVIERAVERLYRSLIGGDDE